jgi:acyl-CoA synthetase (AMP-forming)/AMP-acid ligase II
VLLHEILDNAARTEPDTTALVAEGRRWSFAELHADVRSLAENLAALIEPGDRVAVVAENRAAYVAALYAVPAAGGILVFGNTRHTPGELAEVVQRCDATVLIGTADHLERLAEPELLTVAHRICLDDRTPGALGVSELLASVPPAEHPGTAAPERPPNPPSSHAGDVAWLLFTSGTTGRAKGAMLTHRSLVAAALNTTMARPVAEDEVYLFPFPLFHVAAYNVVHHHLRRRTVVLLPRFDPVEVMAAIEAEGVTSVSLAPTMLAMLLDHPDRRRYDLSSLRTVSYGAAAMPRNLLHRVLAEWPAVGLAQGYGMTELSGNAVFLSPEDHRRAADDDPDLLTAAGRPAPLAALRIVDDRGGDVSPGETGEILVRGDQVCAGYWRDPEATAAAISRGWLHTGDVGRIDPRGYLHVVDRKKDVIITGGENVSSREVEDALGTHPGVASVAIVGMADDTWGEVVVAALVPADPTNPPTLHELRSHVAHLAGFKHPRAVMVIETLPTNASGKVDKVALRALAAEVPPAG